MAKLKFKNGINGTLVDWTPDATLYNVDSIKRRIESKNPGEAGIIVFDKLGLTLGYEAGNNPVYNAFSGNLSAVERYIFEYHGLKSDGTPSKLFEGLADLSTLEWPDLEKKISFTVYDKLSALSIITNTSLQRPALKNAIADRLGFTGNYGVGISKVTLGGVGDCYIVGTWTVKWVNNTATKDQLIPHNILLLQKGDTFLHPDLSLKKKYLVTDSGFTLLNGVQTTWIKVYPEDQIQFDPATWEQYIPILNYHPYTYYNESDICYYEYDSYGRYVVKGFDALLIIKAMLNNAWQNVTIVNRSGSNYFSLSLDYYLQLLDENPFGMHPLDALRMLAGSMQCYLFFNKNGELVLQKKSAIASGTVRTFTPVAKKSGGKKKYFWDKLADAVTVTVKSGKIVDGITLTGTATVKKYPGIQPRNEIKIEIVAPSTPSTVEFTQAALDAYALTVATEVMNFYGKRRFYFNLSTRLQDDMYDWDLLDLIDLNGERYFILSSDINETNKSASFELVSVTGYDYDFQQARAILSTEKYNSTFTSGPSSSSGSGTTIPITVQQPLSMVGAVVTLNYSDNFKLSLDNKLDTIQDIKITSTTIKFERIGFGGDPDLTYKVKNYGDEWIVGNQIIDGVQSIGGAADANFKQKIYGAAKITGNLTVDGDIYIGGTINQVNVVDLNVSDHAIRLNKGGDNTTALDGGLEMLGASDVLLGSIKYNGSAWLSDLNFDIASGKTYKINGTDVLTSTSLGVTVVNSSLTSVGTLTTGVWNATAILPVKIATDANNRFVTDAEKITWNAKESPLTFSYPLSRSVNTISLNYNSTHFSVTTNQLTANNISFTSNNGVTGNAVTLGGTLTISTPQDLRISASPQFVDNTLTGRLDQQGTNNSEFGSQSVLPKQSYYGNLGALNKKWLTLHAAELWVETLVAQDTIATIGGRVLVGPTTSLTQDLTSAATTVYVKHNQMVVNDIVYMEANGKVEFMKILSGPLGTAGNYNYTVQRNLDGTGANDWYSGDAMFNSGQAGSGFIDLYSLRGIKSASQTGPTIVGNVRNSLTYNDWSEHWAIGNLNNLYGYTSNIYGVGLGKYANSSSFITADSTNGIRLRYKNSSGVITDKITLDMAGNVYIANYLQVGTAASDVNSGVTTISGGKITANTITLSQLNFTPVQTSNVVASINASTEGITINANKLTLTGLLQVGGAAADVNNGVTTISGGKITANTITLSQLNFTPVQTSNVVASINASAEGITINANKLTLTGLLQVGGAAADVNNGVTTISGGKITANSITADRMNVTSLQSISATLGGWEVGSTTIANTGVTKYVTIDHANKTIKIYAGDDPFCQMNVGQTAGGISFAYTGYYGISAVNSDGDYIFRLDNFVQKIGGMNFDPVKIYVGSALAGMALNTSAIPFITGINSKGFEVYDVSNPKMFLGLRDGSGVLSAGFDWNITTANKFTVKGEIVSSRFSTVSGFGGTYDYCIIDSDANGSFLKVQNYTDVNNIGSVTIQPTIPQAGASFLSVYAKIGGAAAQNIVIDYYNNFLGLNINGAYAMRWRGRGTSAQRPSTDLREGDCYANTDLGKGQFYSGGAWNNFF